MAVPEQVTSGLRDWALLQYGASAQVSDIVPMPGHAGLSFGFSVGTGGDVERLVIRLAPPGVRRSGNTDVLRQVPVLKALDAVNVPVAAVLWASPSEDLFGTDAYIQRFVDGRPLASVDGVWSLGDNDPRPFLANQIAVLARIHSLDWDRALHSWEQARTLESEIEHWRRLQPKMADPQTSDLADELANALLESRPTQVDVGLFHGDFHSSNVLFRDDASVSAVVDWEICGIGAQLIDIAWLSMMTDARCWSFDHGRALQGDVPADWLLSQYATETGRDVGDAAWFKALACYRFGVITGFNLRLHRTGRRLDPHWEEMGDSCAALLERGRYLLSHPDEF